MPITVTATADRRLVKDIPTADRRSEKGVRSVKDIPRTVNVPRTVVPNLPTKTEP